MKKALLTALLAAAAMMTQAQDKKIEKLKDLYQSKSYPECIEAAKKYNEKNTQNPHSYFYMGFSNYNLYLENPKKESHLTTAENNIYNALRKDKDQSARPTFDSELSRMHTTVSELTTKCWDEGDKGRAEMHATMLARIWNDTTEIYWKIKSPEKFVAPVAYGKQLAAWEGPTNETDVMGNKVGVWIETYPNGKRKTQITYENGKPRGDYYRFYESGGIKSHMYIIDDDRSSAILYDENGDKVAMGYYYKRQKDSLWQYMISDSLLVAEENWHQGVKNGLETTYYIWGLPADETFYKNGIKDGPWRRFHVSGSIQIDAHYKNGMLYGEYSKYGIDGTLEIIGNYKNDLKHGKWKVYNRETKKYIERNYIDGKLEKQAEAEAEETKLMEDLLQKASELPDPKDFANNPEEYFEQKR